jgi:hypothetical protein
MCDDIIVPPNPQYPGSCASRPLYPKPTCVPSVTRVGIPTPYWTPTCTQLVFDPLELLRRQQALAELAASSNPPNGFTLGGVLQPDPTAQPDPSGVIYCSDTKDRRCENPEDQLGSGYGTRRTRKCQVRDCYRPRAAYNSLPSGNETVYSDLRESLLRATPSIQCITGRRVPYFP